MNPYRLHAGVAAIALALPALAHAQSPTPAAPIAPGLARWVDLQNATLNLRYRFIDTTAGTITTNQLQHRESLRGRLKLDPTAKYTLNFGLFTGTRFTSGWDNTPGAFQARRGTWRSKRSTPRRFQWPGVEVQYGGLYIVKGESTELTTYDEDGYVIGQRVSLRRRKELHLDEISVTVGYLAADPREIPISKRTKYLNDAPNYRHFLVDRKFGKRAGLSVDFTSAGGARTWRQGVTLKVPELGAIDAVVFEAYERTNRTADQGFAVTLDKAIHRKVTLNWGYAWIEPGHGVLNADRFQTGNRAFAMVVYNISAEFLASAFITRAIGNDIPLPQRTLSNIVFTYNALPALKGTGLF